MKLNCEVNVPVELGFEAAGGYRDVFNEVEVDVVFDGPGGSRLRVPAFWAGGKAFKARFAAPVPGRYAYRSVCSNADDAGLHGQTGEIDAAPYSGENQLYRRGRLRVAGNRRTFEHSDGTPFLWLGDTWWMGLTKRLDWPDGFKGLAADRVAKGFNLVQIVAGPLPNFHAEDESWHPLQANEAGWPWEQDWARIDPAYYDMADRRIAHLVECGIVPCIVGMWGYYIGFMGVERAKKHWRNLAARYGAYPVAWCIAGEVKLPLYRRLAEPEYVKRTGEEQSAAWTEVAHYVRGIDAYHNLITAHPWAELAGRLSMTDDSALDVDMLQTGHGGENILNRTVEVVQEANAREPRMPVVNGEPCYEGIMGTAWQNQQRLVTWTNLLSGSAGHTYGAQGMWQMATLEEPHAQDWGVGFWPEAMHYPGSAQVGHARRLLERYDWPSFELRAEPEIEQHGRLARFAAGIPGKVWVCWLGPVYLYPAYSGVDGLALAIEPGAAYRAFFFDPRSGGEVEIGPVTPDAQGRWQVPAKPSMEDWVLVIEDRTGAARVPSSFRTK